ncbi:ribosome biogenesis protein Nop53/GLTSCR2 [Sphaerosporella brunnea]|uniref:Ribosome biogenesis protein NOP53 n=1 Tax=Sphaerosporella brunnea TaxID=1250544 RepID=A0A5J5EJC0_9PEZI|nr:ribosome biogenesis protein Nop53/GLTSCR2 [Sphaerosporella brunnea]
MSTGAPKAKQSSRKGKKAWRKNVDITQVETGLETVREEIVQTGGVIAEKPNDVLFSLDLGGDNRISTREKALKPLKADEILSARSAIPAIDTRKRKGATTDGVVEKKAKRKDGLSYSQLQRLRQVARAGQGKSQSVLASTQKSGVPDYDPWADDAEERFKKREEKELEKLDFVDKVVKPQAPATLRVKPVALTAIGSVPAVRRPEAGISYNPEFEKWDQLLKEEGEKEVELEKKRLKQQAAEARIQALIDQPEAEALEPSSSSSSESESESDSDSEADEKTAETKETKRKTQAQRNKEQRQKELQRKREEQKKLKQQERELMLVKKYTRDLKYAEKLRAARLAAKYNKVEDDEANPKIMRKKRFGKIHLPRAPLELQLPDELADSLRTLKPEGNLLDDRFRSLRERGMVEARKPVVARKVKKTATEKWSYKDFK